MKSLQDRTRPEREIVDHFGHSSLWHAFRSERPSRGQSDLRLREVSEIWERIARPSPARAYSVRVSCAMFTAIAGDMPIAEIRREHLLDFRDALGRFPNRLRREDLSLTPEERYQGWARKGRDDRPTLAPSTIAGKVHNIAGLVSFAYAERLIMCNALKGLRLSHTPACRRRSFSKDELRRLLALPFFTRPWLRPWPQRTRPLLISQTTIRWLFVLGMMTGARIEELGQLQLRDVREQDGVWLIRITDLGVRGDRTAKRLKSPSARRSVPLHRRIKDLGFLRLMHERDAAGSGWLFDDLVPNARGKRTHSAVCRCGRVIDQITRDPAVIFHSLRHTFKDLCRAAGIEDSINDQLTGHAPPMIGRAYGDGVDCAALSAAVNRLDFEFIDWEPIIRAVSQQ